MNAAPAVTVEHIVKRYGHLVAVNDVSLSIHEGEIFGIIGPNGCLSYAALVTMAVYTVIFGFISIRYFRWE